jgi:hypothetical protein
MAHGGRLSWVACDHEQAGVPRLSKNPRSGPAAVMPDGIGQVVPRLGLPAGQGEIKQRPVR